MRQSLAVATAVFALAAASSPCVALQVTMSSPKAIFAQAEPIYVWVDYYNNTSEEMGVPSDFLFGFDVLRVRTRSGETVMRPMEQVKRPPPGENRIERIGAKEHLVFFANLLDHVNLTDAGDYDVQILAPNRAPEQYLDPKHPALPPSKLVRGPIESNRWQFTITAGSGEAFDLVVKPLREKTAGTFGLCESAGLILEKYSNSTYGPYAVMCEVERLLNESGQDAGSRYASAQALMDGLQSGQAAFDYLDIAIIRYAERLAKLGQKGTASKLLYGLQAQEHNEVAKLYITRFFRHRAEISDRLTP